MMVLSSMISWVKRVMGFAQLQEIPGQHLSTSSDLTISARSFSHQEWIRNKGFFQVDISAESIEDRFNQFARSNPNVPIESIDTAFISTDLLFKLLMLSRPSSQNIVGFTELKVITRLGQVLQIKPVHEITNFLMIGRNDEYERWKRLYYDECFEQLFLDA